MYEVGRVCVKIAGRDAGQKCVIVDVIDAHTVLIDGETRRRKCNVKHVEPTSHVAHISKGASTADVMKLAKELGFDMKKASAPKKKNVAPKAKHVVKEKPVKAEKPAAKPAKAKKTE